MPNEYWFLIALGGLVFVVFILLDMWESLK
jgi:hypothetical protein